MIHDLDVVASLVRSEVSQVEAIGVPVLTERVDIANVRLRFASGCVANLTASRISQEKMRKLRVWENDSYVSLDYLTQEAWSYRLVRGEGRPGVQRQKLGAAANEEPLKRELDEVIPRARRYSPDYGDFDLEYQSEVLELSGGYEIGIPLTENNVMIPLKSVTALIGLISDG